MAVIIRDQNAPHEPINVSTAVHSAPGRLVTAEAAYTHHSGSRSVAWLVWAQKIAVVARKAPRTAHGRRCGRQLNRLRQAAMAASTWSGRYTAAKPASTGGR